VRLVRPLRFSHACLTSISGTRSSKTRQKGSAAAQVQTGQSATQTEIPAAHMEDSGRHLQPRGTKEWRISDSEHLSEVFERVLAFAATPRSPWFHWHASSLSWPGNQRPCLCPNFRQASCFWPATPYQNLMVRQRRRVSRAEQLFLPHSNRSNHICLGTLADIVRE